jgi:hypothetical protein
LKFGTWVFEIKTALSHPKQATSATMSQLNNWQEICDNYFKLKNQNYVHSNFYWLHAPQPDREPGVKIEIP